MFDQSPVEDADPTSRQSSKTQRVLACVLCQQRKVKCDRKFPCSYCVKSRVQCVPGVQVARQRRRRFPERELLERLRRYEDLLRQNNISFVPLHSNSTGETEAPAVQDHPDPDVVVKPERPYEAK